jgi:GNAT superfamily N-acetyltransferase
MSLELTIRPARPDDRPSMERICAQMWEGDDYVPYVWDEWLADGRGPLIVGELDGQVVALSKITFQTPHQAWLQGMRVDPGFRGRGIAGRFLQYSLAYARDRGARAARLSTADHNTPVHISAGRAGMERIGVYVAWVAEPLPDGAPPSFLSPDDRAQVEAFLRASPVLAFCRGVYGLGWEWQELTPARIAESLEGRLIAAQPAPGGGLAALAITGYDDEDRRLTIGLTDGEPAAVTALLAALRAQATRLGAERVRAFVPDLEWLRDAFRAAGFDYGDWKGALWLFEKRSPQAGEDHEL